MLFLPRCERDVGGIALIKISDVSKIFNDKSGEVVALRGVNLEIGRGDIFGIIGMSGAGK